jgi:hypothetical protein
MNSSCKDCRLFSNGFSLEKKRFVGQDRLPGRIYRIMGTTIIINGRQQGSYCMPPSRRSGRFGALPYPPQRHCIEYGKMLLPQSDKSMNSRLSTTFETVLKDFRFWSGVL